MRRSPLALAALIAVSSLATACSPSSALIAPPTGTGITVGVVLSLTGSQSATGQMAKEGFLYCQEWINGKGGIPLNGVGHRLNLDIADDEGRPSIAASVTEQLISGHHDTLLLGPSNDITARRAVPVAEQHQVPMVGGGVSSDSTFNNPYHYLFSVHAAGSFKESSIWRWRRSPSRSRLPSCTPATASQWRSRTPPPRTRRRRA